ncbi:PilZ domain-containing protein [Labrenzia sp. PHM005]|uniref:PilZ domain-containing protein n=1 Tax=Labrenzia sp. PHM005 TaxID=2590016 RepID=UPI00113FEA6F|nr:PilZ domain-containing protein [Labrenzia sp. PHM005]QDG79061.1 PilZ domain-containing protein [Labrenzia sp. PHM005]
MKEIVEKYSGDSNILVLVLDFETLDCEEAVATSINSSGCRVLSTKHSELDKLIGLRLAGVDKMIKGRIREVRPEEVRVAFEFQDDVACEKRKERRRPVSIAANVSASEKTKFLKCKIVDASLSGCRLHCEHLEFLSDSIILKIPGMDLPVRGCIMWRSGNYAGVKMMWQFSGKTEFMAAEKIKPPVPHKKGRLENGQRVMKAQKSSPFGLKRGH